MYTTPARLTKMVQTGKCADAFPESQVMQFDVKSRIANANGGGECKMQNHLLKREG